MRLAALLTSCTLAGAVLWGAAHADPLVSSPVPAQWGYTIGPQGISIATYPGDVSQPIPALGSSAYPKNWDSSYAVPIDRLNDRVFVGAAAFNTGVVTDQSDWLSAMKGAAWMAGGNALILAETPNGLDAGIFASESLYAQAAGSPIDGISAYGINDGPFANSAWGGYFECRWTAVASNNSCIGVESDPVNLSGVNSTAPDPFAPYPTSYGFAFQAACGGGFDGSSGAPNFGITANECPAALNIAANGSTFLAGINFNSGSISTGNAIVFPHGYGLAWFSSAGNGAGFIRSDATTNTIGTTIDLQDGAVQFLDIAGAESVAISTPLNAVDVLTLEGATTGNAVGMTATGSDTNISIGLNPKGAGTLKIGTTSGVTCPTGSPSASFQTLDGLVVHC
jgi:hypothetical protein